MTDAPDAAPAPEVEPPAAPTAEDAKPKRRFRIGCLGILACAFLLLVLTLIACKCYAVYALRSRIAELRAAGEPITRAEVLATLEPIPNHENSALVIAPHLAEMQRWNKTPTGHVLFVRDSSSISLGVRPSDERLRLLRISLKENAASMDVLRRAAKLPHGRWPVNAALDPVPRRIDWRDLGWSAIALLENECELRATEGDSDGTAESLRTLRRAVASLGDSDFLGALESRLHCGKRAVDAALRALSLCELSAADLKSLRDEFAAEAQQASLHTAIRSTRADMLWMATTGRRALIDDILGSFKHRNADEHVIWAINIIPGVADMEALYGLNRISEWADLVDLPMREMMGKARVTYERHRDDWDGRYIVKLVTWKTMPDAYAHVLSFCRHVMRLQVARAALAVEQYRVDRGSWPEKLADLVPDYLDAVPEDYWQPEGSPIRYLHDATGVRLWAHAYGNTTGLTAAEVKELWKVARVIEADYAFADVSRNPSEPATLQELVDIGQLESIPLDPRTGRPYTYITNPARPRMFIFGGDTGGKTEEEFWGQDISPLECMRGYFHVSEGRVGVPPDLMFRLLNPDLRGAGKASFADETYIGDCAHSMRDLGYTRERLKELGFTDEDVEAYESELRRFEEEER
jgi:hypothetical protein